MLPGIVATREGALYLREHGALVVADLHLGYEGVLRRQGVSLPRFQKEQMIDRLGELLDRYDPGALVVNGDFKHEFSGTLREEWNDVLDVLDFLQGREVEVVMVRGNHDNYLLNILNRKGLPLHDAVRFGDVAVAHGHEEVGVPDLLVMGHEHPSLKLRDDVGATVSLPCFVVSEAVVVLPAFSPLAFGSDVLRGPYLSPFLDRETVDGCRLYGLDEKLGLLGFGRPPEIRKGSSSGWRRRA